MCLRLWTVNKNFNLFIYKGGIPEYLRAGCMCLNLYLKTTLQFKI